MTLVLRAIACGVLNSFYIDLQNDTPLASTTEANINKSVTVILGTKSIRIVGY